MHRRLPKVYTDARARQMRVLVSNSMFSLLAPAYLIFVLCTVPSVSAGPQIVVWLLFIFFAAWMWVPSLVYNVFYLSVLDDLWSGRFSRADLICTRLLSVTRRLPITGERYASSLMQFLAFLRIQQGMFDSAEKLYKEVIEHDIKLPLDYRKIQLATLNYCLGVACAKQDKFLESEICYAKSIEDLGAENVSHAWYRARSICAMGWLHLRKDEVEEGLRQLNEAESIFESTQFPPDAFFSRSSRTSCHLGLALAHAKKREMNSSQKFFDKYLESGFWGNSVADLQPINLLVREYLDAGVMESSEKLLEIAYSIGYHTPFHHDARETLTLYTKLLTDTGRQSEVSEVTSWLRHSPLLSLEPVSD